MTFRKMLVAAAATVLAACGGGGGDSSTPPPNQSTNPPVTNPPVTTPPVTTPPVTTPPVTTPPVTTPPVTAPPVTAPPPVLSSDLGWTVIQATDPTVAGGTATYTVSVSNAGPEAATDATLQLQFDASQQLKAVTCSAAGGAICPTTLGASMAAPTLPSGGKLSFSVAASVPVSAFGTVGLTATAKASNDAATANDSVVASTQVIAPNAITLESDSGDFIGAGGRYSYSNANARLKVSSNGGLLKVAIAGDEDWTGEFQLPAAKARLEPGTFAGLMRYPFHNPAVGGLSWTGEGRGCNTSVGSITVDSVTYSGDTLKAVILRFEQFCEGGTKAIRGKVNWSVYDTTPATGPVTPVPANLWQPPASSLPASGNYVFLTSDAGDYIGQGATTLYTLPGTAIKLTSTGSNLQVDVGPFGGWSANFVGGEGMTRLEQGYYADLQRYPFNNPVKGGMNWSGNGRGCNRLTGWFTVDNVTYTGTTMTSIDLRFEQHCDGMSPALRGKIHWVF